MNINRENYELFMLDFLDGSISEEVKQKLQLFLRENPDIRKEVEGLDNTFLQAQTVSFPKKAELKAAAYNNEEAFNELAVAYMENELSEKEKADFEAYAEKNPSKKRALGLFFLTKLMPDLSVVFPDKELLYHKTKIIPFFIRFGQVAAVAAMLLLAVLLFNPWKGVEPSQVSQQHTPLVQNKTPETTTQTGSDLENKGKGHAPTKQEQSTDFKQIEPSNSNLQQIKPALAQRTIDIKEEVFEERKVYETLKPKKPDVSTYIFIIKPTLTHNNAVAVNNNKPFQNLAKTGEKLLSKGANLEPEQLQKGVLNVLKLASRDRINYKTNNNGKVSQISVKSELLAFTLPIKKNQ